MNRPSFSSFPVRFAQIPAVFLIALLAGALAPSLRAQSLQAAADTVVVSSSASSVIASSALLANDLVGPDSIQVILVSGPSNGTLQQTADGNFMYVPNNGFAGEDGFTYRLQTIPLQRLTVAPSTSSLSFDATLTTDLGPASDQETIPVVGEIVVDLGADAVRIDSVHVTDLQLRNEGDHSLRFDYGLLLGSIRIEAPADSISLAMLRAGETVPTSGLLNSFEQPGNDINITVSASLEGTGILSSQVPSGTERLETQTTESIGGSAIVSGGNVLLLLNVNSSYTFDLEGNAVELALEGALQASGPFQAAEVSNEVSVVIQVVSGADVDDMPNVRDVRLDVYPNPAIDHVTVQWRLPSGHSSNGAEFRVFDLLGREVATWSTESWLPEGQKRMDASSWASGVYVVQILTQEGRSQRIIVRQ